jgi:predicted nicotinamide N-methyase
MIHSTPLDGLEHIVEKVIVEGRTFKIERPAGLDKVFDHPAVRSAYAKDEYIPYWADLWAAARMLAKVILREPWTKLSGQFGEPLKALEIGCGLGLAGIAALSRGLHVTFSDCDESAVKLAGQNARRNGFKHFELLPIDVRSPLEVKFPVIFGSDVMYEERLVGPLVEMIDQSLLPGGVALIADPDRLAAKGFRWMVQNAGLNVEASLIRAGEPGGERTKGTLYRITKNTSASP